MFWCTNQSLRMEQINSTPIIGGILIPLNQGAGPFLTPNQGKITGYVPQLIPGLQTIVLTPNMNINPSTFAVQNVAQIPTNMLAVSQVIPTVQNVAQIPTNMLATSQGIPTVKGSCFPVQSNMMLMQPQQQRNHSTEIVLPNVIQNARNSYSLNPFVEQSVTKHTSLSSANQQSLTIKKYQQTDIVVHKLGLPPPSKQTTLNSNKIELNVQQNIQHINYASTSIVSTEMTKNCKPADNIKNSYMQQNLGRPIRPRLHSLNKNILLMKEHQQQNKEQSKLTSNQLQSGSMVNQDAAVNTQNVITNNSSKLQLNVQQNIQHINYTNIASPEMMNNCKPADNVNPCMQQNLGICSRLRSSNQNRLLLMKEPQQNKEQPKLTSNQLQSGSMVNQNTPVNTQNVITTSSSTEHGDLLVHSLSGKELLMQQPTLQLNKQNHYYGHYLLSFSNSGNSGEIYQRENVEKDNFSVMLNPNLLPTDKSNVGESENALRTNMAVPDLNRNKMTIKVPLQSRLPSTEAKGLLLKEHQQQSKEQPKLASSELKSGSTVNKNGAVNTQKPTSSSSIEHGVLMVHSPLVKEGLIQEPTLQLNKQKHQNFGHYVFPKSSHDSYHYIAKFKDASSKNSCDTIQHKLISSLNAVPQKSSSNVVKHQAEKVEKNTSSLTFKPDLLPTDQFNVGESENVSQTNIEDSSSNKKQMIEMRKDFIDVSLTKSTSDNDLEHANNICEPIRMATAPKIHTLLASTEENERKNPVPSNRELEPENILVSGLKRKANIQEQYVYNNHGVQSTTLKRTKIYPIISDDVIVESNGDHESKPIVTNTDLENMTIDSSSVSDNNDKKIEIQHKKSSNSDSSMSTSDKTKEFINAVNPSPESINFSRCHSMNQELSNIKLEDYGVQQQQNIIFGDLDCIKQEPYDMEFENQEIQTSLKNNVNGKRIENRFIKELVEKIKVEPVDDYELPTYEDYTTSDRYAHDIVQKIKVEPLNEYDQHIEEDEYIGTQPEEASNLYSDMSFEDNDIKLETIVPPIKMETVEIKPSYACIDSMNDRLLHTEGSFENVRNSDVYHNQNTQNSNNYLTQSSGVDKNANIDQFSDSDLVIDEFKEEPEVIDVFKEEPEVTKPLERLQNIELMSSQKNKIVGKQKRRGRVKYTCITCNQRFSSQDDYSHHILNHTGGKVFGCDECQKKFSLKYELASHKDKNHLNTTYMCHYCNKEFKFRSFLMKHNTVHSGIQPYYCDGCGDSFSTNDELIAHRLETGEHPHYCLICGETFAWKSLLKVHQKVHSLEKSFRCQMCSKKFKYSILLLHHRITASHGLPYEYYKANNLDVLTKPRTISVKQDDKMESDNPSPSDVEKTLPNVESEKTLPNADNEKALPSADSEKALPSADSEKTLPNADSEKTLPKVDKHVKVAKPLDRVEVCPFCSLNFATKSVLDAHLQKRYTVCMALRQKKAFLDEKNQVKKIQMPYQKREKERSRINVLPVLDVGLTELKPNVIKAQIFTYRTILPKP